MRNHYFAGLLAALLMPLAAMAQTSVPYAENFDSYTSTSSITPTGWLHMGDGQTVGYTSSSYLWSGTSLEFTCQNAGSGLSSYRNILVLPEFTQPISGLSLTFVTRPEGTYNYPGSFDVGYVTNTSDTASFVAMETYSYSQFNGAYQEMEVIFTGAPAGARMAFRHRPSSYNWYWFIDDVAVALNNCARPMAPRVSDITHEGATLSWSGDAASYVVRLSQNSNVDATGYTDFDVSDTTLTINNLNGSTAYYAWVASICNGDTSGWRSMGSFRTLCTAATVPFLADFENITALDECWSRYSGAFDTLPTLTTTTSGWLLQTSTYSHVMNPGYMRFNIWSTYKYWLVTPAIDLSIDAVLTFDVALTDYSSSGGSGTQANPYSYGQPDRTGTDDRFIVAISTDSDTVWTPLAMWGYNTSRDDYSLNELNPVPTSYALSLTEYTGSIVRLAFVGTSDVSNDDNYLWLDNIGVQSNDCMRPVDGRTEATHNSITLSWSDPSTSTAGYRVLLVADDDTTNVIEMPMVSDTFYTFNNLQPQTLYHYSVYGLCSPDMQPLTGSVATDTSCYAVLNAEVATIGYSSAGLTWNFNEGHGIDPTEVVITCTDLATNTTVQHTTLGTNFFLTDLEPGHNYRIYINTVCSQDTANAVTLTFSTNTMTCGESSTGTSNVSTQPFSPYYKYGYSQTIYPADIVSAMDTIYGVAYYVSTSNGDTMLRKLDVYIGTTAQSTFTSTSYINPASLTLVKQDYHHRFNHQGWDTILFDTPFPYSGGNIVMAMENHTGVYKNFSFRGHSTTGSTGIYWRRDSPARPYALDSLTSGTTTSSVPDVQFIGNCDFSCVAPQLLLTSIDSVSAHLSWVAGNDETSWTVEYRMATDTAWTAAASAISDTGLTILGLEPASDYLFRVGALCGNGVQYSDVIQAFTACAPVSVPVLYDFNYSLNPCWDNNSNAYRSNNQLYVSSTGQAILPVLADNINSLQMHMYVRPSSTTARFRIGVTSDGSNTIDWYDTVSFSSTDTTDIFVYFDQYSSNGNRIVIGGLSGTAYFKWIRIEELASCLPLEEITVDSIIANRVYLSWEGTAQSYLVYVGNNAPIQVYDNYCELTTLDPVTDYTVRVSVLCNTNDTSYPVSVSFRTGCAPYTVPFMADFEGITALDECWNRYSGAFDTLPTLTTTTSGWSLQRTTYTQVMNPNYMRFNIYSTYKYWLVTPAIDLSIDAALTFDVALTDYSSSGGSGTQANPYSYGQPDRTGTDDRFIVAISTDGGTSWKPIAMWGYDTVRDNHSMNELNPVPTSYALSLTEYTGSIVRLAFVGTSDVSNDDNYLWLDNIGVQSNDCMRPADGRVEATHNSITLSWSDPSTSTAGYRVLLNTSDDTVGAIELPHVTDTFCTFNNLQPQTLYHYFIYGLCSPDMQPLTGSVATDTSCYAVRNATLAGTSSSGAALQWTYLGNHGIAPTGVVITCIDRTTPDTIVFNVSDTTTSVFLTGLTAGHNYRAYLTTVCAPDTAEAVYIDFSTEALACGESPTGTSSVSSQPFSPYYKYGYSQTIYPAGIVSAMDTIYGVAYYVSTSNGDTLLRKLDIYIGTTAQSTFTSTSYINPASLTLVKQDYHHRFNHQGWDTILFDTPFPYSGGNIVMAMENHTGVYKNFSFRGHSTTGSTGIYWRRDSPARPYALDSLTSGTTTSTVPDVQFVGNCDFSCLRPVAMVQNVTSNSADLSWAAGGTETAWRIEYRATNDTAWTTFLASTTNTSCTITGLTPATQYEFRVGALCGNTAKYTVTDAVYTECDAVHIPVSYTFAQPFSPCWDNTSVSRSSSTASPYTYYASIYGTSAQMVLPEIAEPIDSTQLHLFVATTSSTASIRIGALDANGTVNWFASHNLTASSTIRDYHEEVVYLNGYTGTDHRIVIGSGSSATLYFYEITVEPLETCLPVTDLALDNVTENSATLSWNHISATDFEVQYRIEGTSAWNSQLVQGANMATLTYLAGSTGYEARVRAICGTGDSSYWRGATLRFNTSCGITPLPYNQNFNTTEGSTYSAAGVLPPCWEGFSDGSNDNYLPHVVASGQYHYSPDNTNSLCMTSGGTTYGSTKITVLPTFADPINNLTLSFWYAMESTTYGTLTVGYVTGSDYNATFTNVKVINSVSSSNGAYDTVDFSSVPPTATNIAFRWYYTSIYYSACIDNISVWNEFAPSCPLPVVGNATATAQTATIHFTADNDCEVLITSGPWDNNASGILVSADSSSYTFRGLNPETTYTIGVRQVCDTGVYSDWVIRTVTTDEMPCPKPTDLHIEQTSYSSFIIAWTPAANTDTWEVLVFNTADTHIATAVTSRIAVTDLYDNTLYNIVVRPLCGADRNVPGESSDTITAQTLLCAPVDSVSVGYITDSSATVSWTATGGIGSFVINYGLSGFSVGTGEYLPISGTSFTLTGLESNTVYDLYVASSCAPGLLSAWSERISFTTLETITNGIGDAPLSAPLSPLHLFPNPASSTVTIYAPDLKGLATVTLVDMNGRIAATFEIQKAKTELDISSLAAGAYFLRVTASDFTAIRKLIVK